MFGDIDDDEIILEDERLRDNRRLLNWYADRQFLELAETPISVETAVREVERQYWRDVLLDELEEGEDGEYLYVFEEEPVHREPRWLQNNNEIPSRVLDRYLHLVEQSSLPEDVKRRWTVQLQSRRINWLHEGF